MSFMSVPWLIRPPSSNMLLGIEHLGQAVLQCKFCDWAP